MRRLLIVLLLLGIPSSSRAYEGEKPARVADAAPTITVPETVKVKLGRLAKITVKSSGKVKCVNTYEGADIFREYTEDPNTYVFRFVADEAGDYLVAFITGNADGPSDPVFTTITVTDDNPAPTPNPTPQPPAPSPPTPPKPVVKPTGLISVIYVIDKNKDAASGALVENADLRAQLKATGIVTQQSPHVLDSSSTSIATQNLTRFVADASGPPCMILLDAQGKVWLAQHLPSTAAEILAAVKRVGGQ